MLYPLYFDSSEHKSIRAALEVPFKTNTVEAQEFFVDWIGTAMERQYHPVMGNPVLHHPHVPLLLPLQACTHRIEVRIVRHGSTRLLVEPRSLTRPAKR
ncbi:MAG: hypothetical protein V4850_28525 [Myxococcota bacterium]